MKRFAVSVVVGATLFALGGCGTKKAPETAQTEGQASPAQEPAQPAAAPTSPEAASKAAGAPPGEMTPDVAAPNDLPATVTLSDGSKYTGVLVSKQGTQLTFQGENGATRSFDSRDIRSIRFGNPAEPPAPKPAKMAKAPAQPAQSAQPAPPPAEPAPATSSAPAAPTPAPAPVITHIVIPSGTQISVRTNEAIDAKATAAGQTYSAEISEGVVDENGDVAIPRGANATLVIRQASAGKLKSNELALGLASLAVRGRNYEVQSGTIYEKGKEGVGANKRTAKYVGGVAALGAIVGAIAGGGKGAAIGAASGAGAGAGAQILTRGSIKIPAETVLTFQLQSPLRLDAR